MKIFKFFVLLLFCLFQIVSCGKKSEEKKNEGFTYEKKSNSDTQKAENNPNDIVITSNDAMQFNKKEIKVMAGKKVKLTLKHIGKLDKKIMGHNFVLLKQGVNLVSFANKAASSSDTEYIPTNSQDIIAHTKLIGAGETVSIEFNAPETGEYDFLCTFPGHYSMMRGVFIVE